MGSSFECRSAVELFPANGWESQLIGFDFQHLLPGGLKRQPLSMCMIRAYPLILAAAQISQTQAARDGSHFRRFGLLQELVVQKRPIGLLHTRHSLTLVPPTKGALLVPPQFLRNGSSSTPLVTTGPVFRSRSVALSARQRTEAPSGSNAEASRPRRGHRPSGGNRCKELNTGKDEGRLG